ncbi:MAG TPA: hypothetical protein VJM33_07460 [Microthrixaceae bacterium]|nr:hypothetical protein [Microthrixaceae bacterium]
MKRLVAVLVAAGLIAAAVFIRRALDDDEAGGDDGSGADGTPTLICATEAAEACDRLEQSGLVELVTTEPAGATADRLAAGEALGADGWLTADFWPGMVEVVRDPNLGTVDLDASDVLASSAVIVARAPSIGENVQSDECGGAVTWACFAERAGSPPFRIGIDPTDESAGLATAAMAAAGIVGDVPPRPEEMEDEAVRLWRTLPQEVEQTRGEPVLTTLATFQGQFDLATGFEVIRRDRTPLLAVPPEPTVGLVIAGDPGRFDTEAVARALGESGWERGGATQGLPGPGVMVALRDEWEANAR